MRILRDVFTPGGQPSVTYVSRDHLGLENRVSDALARGFSINVVTGPTKSGKTVLCNHVLTKLGNSVTVEGGQVRSEEDFWAQIVDALDLGHTRTRKYGGTEQGGLGASLEVGISGGPKLALEGDAVSSRVSERIISYDVLPIRKSLDSLLEGKISLLVDDFRYIPQDVQKAIIQSLKGAVFKGLSVILLAVPHRAFDPITVEDELQGRFKHIEIPAWDIPDLVLIPERGFAALNVTVSKELSRAICAEGFGNPLLVQEVCSELCLKNKVYEE